MKGYRFYAVMPTERNSKSASKKYPHFPFTRAKIMEAHARGVRTECFALDASCLKFPVKPGGAGETFDGQFGSVAWCSVDWDWLRARCVRVSEEQARTLHPELFRYLESN